MTGGHPKKICVVCHQDCSGKPRTKDSKGNYFCTPCYEQRLQDVREGKARSLAPPVLDGPAPQLDDDIFATDPSLIAQEPAAPPSSAATAACPSCGTSVQAGAVICLNCGANIQSGGHMRTNVYAAPRGRIVVWPIVVGVITIVFCGIIIMLQLASLLGDQTTGFEALQSNPDAAPSGTYKIGVVISIALATWGLLAGAGVTFKQVMAVAWLRAWAITNIALCCIAGTCVGIGFAAASGSGRTAQLESGLMEFLLAALVIALLISMSWPIFVLVWFGRAKVQDDINQW